MRRTRLILTVVLAIVVLTGALPRVVEFPLVLCIVIALIILNSRDVYSRDRVDK